MGSLLWPAKLSKRQANEETRSVREKSQEKSEIFAVQSAWPEKISHGP
jgi:hypothetical protein